MSNMIRRLSARELKVLIFSSLLAAAYIGYILLVRPAKEKFISLDEEIAAQQRRLVKTSMEIKKAGDMEKILAAYEQKFKQPASNEGTMSSLLSEIEAVAADLKLQIANLTPKRVKETNFSNRFSVSLSIDGDFMDILQFLHRLQGEPHLFDVEEARFDKGTRQQAASVKASLVFGKTFFP